MQQDTTRHNALYTHQEMQNTDIQRIASHFHVSQEDVKDRLAMIEEQKEMTRAFMKAGAPSRG